MGCHFDVMGTARKSMTRVYSFKCLTSQDVCELPWIPIRGTVSLFTVAISGLHREMADISSSLQLYWVK